MVDERANGLAERLYLCGIVSSTVYTLLACKEPTGTDNLRLEHRANHIALGYDERVETNVKAWFFLDRLAIMPVGDPWYRIVAMPIGTYAHAYNIPSREPKN